MREFPVMSPSICDRIKADLCCDLSVGITGILCSRFCKRVVLTDHNDEVLEARFKLSEIHSLIPQFQRQIIEQNTIGYLLYFSNYVFVSKCIQVTIDRQEQFPTCMATVTASRINICPL